MNNSFINSAGGTLQLIFQMHQFLTYCFTFFAQLCRKYEELLQKVEKEKKERLLLTALFYIKFASN